ncbi:SMP-30/gluconolactonase/LRE family protein [Nonomuraea sp. CA-141351]|uniref:SMP-30/gluconolactonase/LRE family protein n=1 Tax=Nonomuraea sp. CA-141351 TaxID=3239996 RepID=UPI003D8F86FF
MSDTSILLSGLAIGESPRWHEDRLWFSNWGTQEIIALDTDGAGEVMMRVPTTVPFSIDWLPDGTLLVVQGPEALLLRQERDGALVPYADLGPIAKGWNEIVVDRRGFTYVNGSDFDFMGGGPFVPGLIALVTPDGVVRQVADGIEFGNGMVVTPDGGTLIVAESFASRLTAFDIAADGGLSNRRVWAQLETGPDGICLDAEGAVWAASMGRCVRVREGGEILGQVVVPEGLSCFACALGGADRRTLFVMAAQWLGVENMFGPDRTGQVRTTRVAVPGIA